MANASLADLVLFRNQQIQINEQMATCLWNIEALMSVVLTTNNFFDLTKSTMHHYFSVIADFINQIPEFAPSFMQQVSRLSFIFTKPLYFPC